MIVLHIFDYLAYELVVAQLMPIRTECAQLKFALAKSYELMREWHFTRGLHIVAHAQNVDVNGYADKRVPISTFGHFALTCSICG